MRPITERVITVDAAKGTTNASNYQTLDVGQIVGVAVFHNYKGDGTLRAKITDNTGEIISQLQHIDNYRSREAAYKDSYKPLLCQGNQKLSIDIINDITFDKDVKFDFVFIYDFQNFPTY